MKTHLIVALSNGVRVANFSSPHSFEFVDGTILPAVPDELCKELSMYAHERVHIPGWQSSTVKKNFDSIEIEFWGNPRLREEIELWRRLSDTSDNCSCQSKVDVVIVPLPVMQWIRKEYNNIENYTIYDLPFRTIRVADRISKKICIDKFCM